MAMPLRRLKRTSSDIAWIGDAGNRRHAAQWFTGRSDVRHHQNFRYLIVYMDFVFLFAYAAVYFVGYYGYHMLNLSLRRVMFKNLRLTGLGLVAVVAAIVAMFIEVNTPSSASAFAKGQLIGGFAIAPALIVCAFVAVRMRLDNKKHRKFKLPDQ